MIKKQDLFHLLIIILYFIAHFYIVWHINYGLGLQFPFDSAVKGFVLIMGLISVFSLVAIKISSPLINWTHTPGHAWMGIFGITIICFIFNDIVNLVFHGMPGFRFYSTSVTLAVDALMCLWSGANAAFLLRVKTIHIGVQGLKLNKLKIAFIADIHINRHTPFKKINNLVDKINSIKPDIILIGGDFADTDITETYYLYGLEKLQARFGMYAVTGNHEYHLGVEKFLELCAKLNIRVLRNENADINGIINIAGINDDFGEKLGIDTSDLKAAFEDVNPELPVIFLSHKPDNFRDAVKQSRKMRLLQLSGHTHGGQIPPMGIIGSMFFKYYYGKWTKENAIVYITSGAGWWGPPMRLFNISEIAEIILYRKNK